MHHVTRTVQEADRQVRPSATAKGPADVVVDIGRCDHRMAHIHDRGNPWEPVWDWP
jgi:hypothetical protein